MDEEHSSIVRAKLAAFFGAQYVDVIEMSKCSDPKEIMWHHLQHFSSRKLKILYGWFLSLVFLLVFFIIFYFLSELKAKELVDAAHEKGGDA